MLRNGIELLGLRGRFSVAQFRPALAMNEATVARYQANRLRDGPGGHYLVQHSAGSGKADSIAWSAHFLADLHDARNDKVFDSVIVVSDRTVTDTQLQEAIMDAYDAHTAMSTRALGSEAVRRGLKEVLLDYAGLYEALREGSGAQLYPASTALVVGMDEMSGHGTAHLARLR